VPDLAVLGLRPGEEVRYRRADRRRWQLGRATRVERDGSIGIIDADGASRSIAAEHVEVSATTVRGRRHWEPLLARATRTEQLPLFMI
jgi:hypothetical protein